MYVGQFQEPLVQLHGAYGYSLSAHKPPEFNGERGNELSAHTPPDFPKSGG